MHYYWSNNQNAMLTWVGWITVTCHQDHQDAVHITAILGESVVFNCQVDFPEDIPVPYVLQWEKKVGETVRRSTLHSYNTTLLIYRVCFCSVENGSSPDAPRWL